jgi:RNA polymerase primary sigma factor
MLEQNKLLECMEEIKEIAHSQDNRLTTGEIKQYLNEMNLEESQFEAVYQYLAANKITIEGYIAPKKEEKPATKSARNLAKYRNEVSALKQLSPQEISHLWYEYLTGKKQVREDLIHSQLGKVIEIAQSYRTRGVSLDEVIAEGNIGVLTAMEYIGQNTSAFLSEDTADRAAIDSLMEKEIRSAMETMIDLSTETSDQESSILAKTNLLHEAAKYLAEENGKVPSPEELAKYTRLPLKEVYDITGLSRDTKKISG